MIKGTPSYSQALRNIFTLMANKKKKISSQCFRQVMGLSNGLPIILEIIQGIHTVLDKALSMVKKSLLPSIQIKFSAQFTQELS
jgi:hypothetical protein